MINILGKINKDNYQKFTNSDFFGYEVYLGSEDDFRYLPEMMRRLNIISVHQPCKDFNLCSNQRIGDISFKIILRMLSALNENGYKGMVVVHGALFDETISLKDKHFKILAKRVDKLAILFPEIKITLETDVMFFNQIKSHRALLTESEDFIKLKRYLKTQLYITLDFEHIWITSIFKNFLKSNPQFYIEVKSLKDLHQPEVIFAKRAWLGFIVENKGKIKEIASGFLRKYSQLKSSIINFHLNGSDVLKYWFDSKTFLPLAGEHSSIIKADDMLNYELIKENVKKLTELEDVNLVLEIWPRKSNRYVVELKKSGEKVREVFKTK